MTAPTLFDRWTEDQELHRVGCLAAGVQPRLHGFWASCTTAQLVVSLDEYRTLPADLDLQDVIALLETEIAYRTDPA